MSDFIESHADAADPLGDRVVRDPIVGAIPDVAGLDWREIVDPGSALGHVLAGPATERVARFNNYI